MFKFEKKIVEFCEKHFIVLSFIFVTLVALAARYPLRNFFSGDFGVFNNWVIYFRNNGGLRGLSNYPGDYNAPYMTIVALLSYLPLKSMAAIKIFSIGFDFLLAIAATLLVRELLKGTKYDKFILLLTYATTLFLPSVLLNSAQWAQSDAIYTTFVILALLFLVKEKYFYSFLMLGVAFGFKLQFIFILPLFIVLYVCQKKFSILNFLLIPAVDILMCTPALIMGMPFAKIFSIYLKQAGEYSAYLVMNFPNIYNLIPNVVADIYYPVGEIITILACFMMLIYLIYKKVKWNNEKIITLGLWFLVIVTFLLPGIHERYLFTGEILVLVYMIVYRRKENIPIMIMILLSNFITYSNFLNALHFAYMDLLSIAYLVVIIYFTINVVKLLGDEHKISRKNIQ